MDGLIDGCIDRWMDREGMCPVCAGSAGPVAPLASKLLVLSKEAIACICMGYQVDLVV